MTAQNPPIFLQTTAAGHPAEDVRRWIATLTRDTPGVIGSGDLAVTAATGMNVTVAGGRAFISGTQGTYQGSYFAENRGTSTLTVSGGHATYTRKDLVVARIEDAAYSGATNAWSLAIIAGTPAASPAEPSAPANSITLAMITVPAGATSIAQVTITDRRVVSIPPGVPVFTDSTTRARAIPTPTAGMLTFITAPGAGLSARYEVYNGSAWVRLRPEITVSTSAPSGGEDGDVWITVA